MTLYWWTHWFWITVCGVVLIECTPLSSIDSYPGKMSPKLDENSNKSTYLKRAGELPLSPGGGSSSSSASGGGSANPGKPGSPFISSLPPMAAASSGILSSSSSNGSPGPPPPTANSILSPSEVVAVASVVSGQDVDDTFASGSLAGTDFGPDVTRYTRKDSSSGLVGGSSTVASVPVSSSENGAGSSSTAATVAGSGRFKKNGTIFVRNEQNITTLKLKNYNRGLEKEDFKVPPRVPDRGSPLMETLMLTAVENSTSPVEVQDQDQQATEAVLDEVNSRNGNTTDMNSSPDEDRSGSDNTTFSVKPHPDDDGQVSPPQPQSSMPSDNINNNNNQSSFRNSDDSDSDSSSDTDIPDSHSDSGGSVPASDRRIGKILSSDFRDFVSSGSGSTSSSPTNASSYISRAIAFSTQNLQEGVDDQDHPLEDDDYRRSSRSQQRLNVGAISGICLASLGLLSGISAALIILYRRYLYLNKPQTLSEPDSSGYIDDSTIRDNSDEMYSLDNDSFLNSLEAMTIQNYWTDNVKHTKL